MRKSSRAAPTLVAVPPMPSENESLRSVYERQAPLAISVARVLVREDAAADQIVVDAFAALACRPNAVGLDHERRLTLENVVECFRSWSHGQVGEASPDQHPPLESLSDDHRVVIALSARGGCSLGEIAMIVDAPRDVVARQMREALSTVARERALGYTVGLERDSGAA